MKVMRLTVRCTQDTNHAKILEFKDMDEEQAKRFAGLLDGTSPAYIHPPGPGSPIGKCGLCGGKIEVDIAEWKVLQAPKEEPEECGKTNRNGGYMSCVKPAGHLGNHEDVCGCWWI